MPWLLRQSLYNHELPYEAFWQRQAKSGLFKKAKFTLTLQKSRMPQVQGVEGEAVVIYCEPSTIRQGRTSVGDAVLSAFLKGKQQVEKSIEKACYRK